MSKKIYVGMSGGVDSSVAAALLQQQGYRVTGVYMKNWSQDLPGFICPWKRDYQDAKRVAVKLGIDFKLYDFETEYRQKVVDYMIDGYRKGITPNPDIMCNQEVKFKLFLETALQDGADMIATGHYARIKAGQLFTGLDDNKDQSYFLYRVSSSALKKTLMPIGELQKPAVRQIAKSLGLATADKRDSQGICFIGKVGIKDFLLAELGSQPRGVIIDQADRVIGEHDGALFYTIGQRQGLNVGGGLPFYVVGKSIAKNEVYVTTDLQDERLWKRVLRLGSLHWINQPPRAGQKLQVRSRHRAPLIPGSIDFDGDTAVLTLRDDLRAVTPGQSAVVYDGELVMGGGIVI